jgi:hypothetical protein
LTKYDPRFRLPDGTFGRNEWTGIADIGKTFETGTLSLDEYLVKENAYVESIRRLMSSAGVTSLVVSGLELDPDNLGPEFRAAIDFLREGAALSGEELDVTIRICLRGLAWCRLEGEHGTYLHFGYDLYTYFGSRTFEFELPKLPQGMYAEPFESPHEPETDIETN